MPAPYAPTAPANPYGVPQSMPPTGYGTPTYGAAPPQNPYSSPTLPVYNVPPQAQPPVYPYNAQIQPPPLLPKPQQRGPNVGILIGVALLVLVLVGAGIFVFVRLGQNQPPALATPTAVQTTPTITTAQNPYPPHTGTLVLDDPMQDNSKGNKWDESTLSGVGTCGFAGGTYHIKVMKTGLICNPEASNLVFSNLAFEAKVTILQGDAEGIDIRIDQTKGTGYLFSIDTQGNFVLTRNDSSSQGKTLSSGSHGAINKGFNQPNLLAIVANGSTISVYVNNQFVASATDSMYTQGQIGVFGSSSNSSADVVVSDARVWTL